MPVSVTAKLPAPRLMFGIVSGYSVHLHGCGVDIHCAEYSFFSYSLCLLLHTQSDCKETHSTTRKLLKIVFAKTALGMKTDH